MKIAIDLRPLQIGHQNRGIGAYLLNLLHRLPQDPEITYIFIRYDHSKPLEDFEITIDTGYKEVVLKKYHFSKHPKQLFMYVLNGLMPNYQTLRKYRPDVFFQTDYLLGAPRIRKCRVITVSYDLIPLKLRSIYLPHWTKYIGFRQIRLKSRVRLVLRAWFYEFKYARGISLLRRSNKLISISDSTRQDLVELLNIPANKITVIYPAASFRDEGSEDETIRPSIKKIIDGIDAPFVTYIGGTDLRRQVDELVLGCNLYNARVSRLALVLCGNEFDLKGKETNPKAKRAIEESSYRSDIYALGKITEAEKKYILTKAAAFVYPTIYEGFGLPLLEAMACGTPIIAYRNSSIPEIADDFPLYTEGVGGYNIFLALYSLLSNKSITAAERETAIKRAKSFSWERCASETWGIVTGS